MAALKSTARRHGRAATAVVSDVAGQHLGDHVRTLRLVLDILIVCDMALRLQGAEQDEEIAEVLRYCGSNRLQGVIEEVEGIQREWGAKLAEG